MPLPRALARFNRRVTNPLLAPLVTRLPGFGFLVHVGRRSGRIHRTPVLAFRRGRQWVIALTYGTRTDWARNVVAAGWARFERRGRAWLVADPRLVHDESRALVPSAVRPVLRLVRAADFLVLRSTAYEPQGICNLRRWTGNGSVGIVMGPPEEPSIDDRHDPPPA